MSHRAIAYQVGAGHTGEWCKRNSSMANPCGDFSKPMLEHFRDWLRKKYSDNVAILRRSWNDYKVTFETAEVPSENQQLNAQNYSFRNPQLEQNVIDYFQCLAELCADLIIDFCHTIKETRENMSLAGAFYGYILEMSWNSCFFAEWNERWQESEYGTLQRSGHLGLKKVLESPFIDFLVSPYSYGFRGIGGDCPCMQPSESMRKHGKLYIYEEDSRLHTDPFHTNYGRAQDLSQSRAILRRNFSYLATHGFGVWTFLNSDKNIFEEIKSFKKLGDIFINTDRSSRSEIAVLIDNKSFFYESLKNSLDIPLIFHQRLQGLSRIGAPCDYYLLDDILDSDMKHYKLYIFLNAFHLDYNRRDKLKEKICKDNNTIVWIYAPGYINVDVSLDNMYELTGFKFGKGTQPWSSFMHITNFDHQITRNIPQDLFWGTESHISPHFHIQDDSATILGQVVYSQGSCVPGMGIKNFDNWNSIYVASPNIPASVLRGIAKFANVHLYTDKGDIIYTGKNLLGVHSISGGRRQLKLPEKVEQIYDVFEKAVIAHDTDRFQVKLKPISTSLFYLGDDQKVINQLLK